MTALPCFASPWTPKLSTPPNAFGRRSCLARVCDLCEGRPGYDTQAILGCCSSHLGNIVVIQVRAVMDLIKVNCTERERAHCRYVSVREGKASRDPVTAEMRQMDSMPIPNLGVLRHEA